jgi:High potential iron-sulfur protein
MTTRRRTFIQIIPVAVAALLGTRSAFAVDVDPKEAQASALGYVVDATKADKAKFPKYAVGQECGNCQLYQGKAGDAVGPCALFPGKTVAAKGWCSAYVKKA